MNFREFAERGGVVIWGKSDNVQDASDYNTLVKTKLKSVKLYPVHTFTHAKKIMARTEWRIDTQKGKNKMINL